MANREREIQLKFRVTPEERELIEAKMAQLGTQNMAAYLRKMALDGYVVRLELPELREMVSLLRRSSNNLNQLTRRVHETGRIYDADLEDLRQGQEKLWEAAEHILSALAALKLGCGRRPELWLAAPLSFLAASLQKEAGAAMLKSETKTAHEVKELIAIC